MSHSKSNLLAVVVVGVILLNDVVIVAVVVLVVLVMVGVGDCGSSTGSGRRRCDSQQ